MPKKDAAEAKPRKQKNRRRNNSLMVTEEEKNVSDATPTPAQKSEPPDKPNNGFTLVSRKK